MAQNYSEVEDVYRNPINDYLARLGDRSIYFNEDGLIEALKSMSTKRNMIDGFFRNLIGVRHYENMIRSIERAASVYHRNYRSYKVKLKKIDKNVKKHCIEIKKNLEGKINKRPGWDKNKKKEELEALTRILSNYEDDIIKSLYIIEFYPKFLDAEERDYLKMIDLNLKNDHLVVEFNPIEIPKINQENQSNLELIFMKSTWDFTKTLVKELENYCDPNKKRTRTRQNALLCLLERAKKDLESIKRLEVFRINSYINKGISFEDMKN